MRHGGSRWRQQKGFLVMAAVFLLVVVAAYIAYLGTQSNVQQSTTILDVQSARALQAARAGIEWGAFQVLRNNTGCGPGPFPGTLTFAGTTLSDFSAVVTCTASGSISEGGNAVTVYQITSTGCNAATCPGTPTSVYAERQLTVTIAR